MNTTAYVLVEPGKPLEKKTVPLRDPGPSEALIDVIGCGLCHTDLGYARGEVPTKKAAPLVLGHEVVGRVKELGGSSTTLKVGDAVLLPAVLPCGECAFCKSGRGNACPEQHMPGNTTDGGFAEQMVAPARLLMKLPPLPPGMEIWPFAVVADAVSTAYQAVKRSGLREGDVAVVVGSGGVGAFTIQIAAALGAHVLALDVRKNRLELAQRHGAEQALDAAGDPKAVRSAVRSLLKKYNVPSFGLRLFECSGTPPGQTTAFGLLERGATLVQVGYTPNPVSLKFSNLMAFDATVHGTWGCPVEAYPAVLDLIATNKVKLDDFVERAPMSRVNEHLHDMHEGRLERRLVLDPRA